MNNIALLDCTLRDGGYINEWNFGENAIRDIIQAQVDAGIDYVEVGFLRDDEYNPNCAIYNNISQIKNILPSIKKNTQYVAMILHNKYDIDKLENCDNSSVSIIRVTFHDYDIEEGLNYAQKVAELGYKVFCNPINLLGYSDEKIIQLIKKINEIKPYGFSIVDTFGTAMYDDLVRIYYMVDNNLDKNIVIGLHLHDNFSLAYSLAQDFVRLVKNRKCVIDGSLLGMGREPGNLCLELITDYMVRIEGYDYDINPLLDAIDDYVTPIKNQRPWGYNIAYAMSARYNLHRNYAEYLLGKGRLRAKQINVILASVSEEKKSKYDEKYIEELYFEFQASDIDDEKVLIKHRDEIANKRVLIIAPGSSINLYRKTIEEYISQSNTYIIAANFDGEGFETNAVFYTNQIRFSKHRDEVQGNVFYTSNIQSGCDSKLNCIDFATLAMNGDFLCDNCVIMLLRYLVRIGIREVAIAGFDGFSDNSSNYANYYEDIYEQKNFDVKRQENIRNRNALQKLKSKINVIFLTPSIYDN